MMQFFGRAQELHLCFVYLTYSGSISCIRFGKSASSSLRTVIDLGSRRPETLEVEAPLADALEDFHRILRAGCDS